jgi:hypothetical protein
LTPGEAASARANNTRQVVPLNLEHRNAAVICWLAIAGRLALCLFLEVAGTGGGITDEFVQGDATVLGYLVDPDLNAYPRVKQVSRLQDILNF